MASRRIVASWAVIVVLMVLAGVAPVATASSTKGRRASELRPILSDSCIISGVATEKISATVDTELLAEIRAIAGPRGLSSFVTTALRRELERARLREFLDELMEQVGPPDEAMVTDAIEALTSPAGGGGRAPAA